MTPSGPSVSETEYRSGLRSWLRANVPAHFLADSVDYREPTFEELVTWERNLYRAGLAGVYWPKAYGGHGLAMDAQLIASQEIGRLALPESVGTIGKEIAGAIVLSIGTEAQKQAYLHAILNMDEIWCQAFSEPQAGSDLAAVTTRASRHGDVWRVSGQKIWTSFAKTAKRCLLLARTGDPENRYKNLTLFVIPTSAPGIDIRPIRQIDGSSEFNEVFFDEVEVAHSDVLGEVNGGWKGAVSVLSVERATNRMYRGWRFENEFNHLLSACRQDQGLASPLNDTAIRQELATTAIDIRATQAFAEDIADRIMSGRPLGEIGSMMKLHWSEAHQRFADLALRILGPGKARETAVHKRARQRFERIYLRARSETLIAGSSEVQLSIIADRLLGLPKG